ncbi:MAG: hypothetical protein FVQ84_21590 [Planctomycetes bacterium]|nr:hypothetical protein [Planctomycetota bacterium]
MTESEELSPSILLSQRAAGAARVGTALRWTFAATVQESAGVKMTYYVFPYCDTVCWWEGDIQLISLAGSGL